MSLDKSIKNGREHRKPYRKSKAVDRTCRNHGSCPYCKANRLYSTRKRLLKATCEPYIEPEILTITFKFYTKS